MVDGWPLPSAGETAEGLGEKKGAAVHAAHVVHFVRPRIADTRRIIRISGPVTQSGRSSN